VSIGQPPFGGLPLGSVIVPETAICFPLASTER
jgi:hypothetical protein